MQIKIGKRKYDVTAHWSGYPNGRTALYFRDSKTGEPIAKASVNLPEVDMDMDEMALNHDHADDLERELKRLGFTTGSRRTVQQVGIHVVFVIVRLDLVGMLPSKQLC